MADHTTPKIPIDGILRYLMDLNLADREADFRGMLGLVAKNRSEPAIHELVIATTALLMAMGGISRAIVDETILSFKDRSPESVRADRVILLNGSHLMLPSNNERGVVVLDLGTLREVENPPPAYVATVYNCSEIWSQAEKILS